MSDIKTYCYKDTCSIVETGAVQSIWLVCKFCKSEVSEGLKKQVEDRQEARRKSEESVKEPDTDLEDYSNLFGF